MKDYSNFIQTSYGFIKKYEIVNNQILVYTSENEKGEPHIYTANRENINYIDERLGNQYKLILKNRKIIKEEFVNRKCKFIRNIGIVLMILCLSTGCILMGTVGGPLALLISILSGSLVFAGSFAIAGHMEDKFEEELNIYQEYLSRRGDIAKKRDEDLNVTRYLSDNATCNIKEKEQLRDSGLIDIAFNIDFMDKTKLKDLRKLLTSYYICEDLKKKQTFVVPNEYKKRVKIKKEKSNKDEEIFG